MAALARREPQTPLLDVLEASIRFIATTLLDSESVRPTRQEGDRVKGRQVEY